MNSLSEEKPSLISPGSSPTTCSLGSDTIMWKAWSITAFFARSR